MTCRQRVAVVSTLLLLLSGCTDQPKPAAPVVGARSLPSVDEVYALVGQSLRKAGVLHLVITGTSTLDGKSSTSTRDLWVDATHDLVRSKETTPGGAAEPAILLLDAQGVRWADGRPGSPQACHGQSASVGEVLGCPGPTETVTEHIERGRSLGHDVTVLVRDKKRTGGDSGFTSVVRMTLDPLTALPTDEIETGTFDNGQLHPLQITLHFRSNPASAVARAPSFFTPAALGLHLPDPTADLPRAGAVYWLGRTWAPGGTLPPLELSRVEQGTVVPATTLSYAARADRFGPALLTVQTSSRAAYEAARIHIGIPRCPGPPTQIAGRADVDFYCNAGSRGITAFVHLPDAVLVVNAPGVSGSSGVVTSPYDEPGAIGKAVAALRLRVP